MLDSARHGPRRPYPDGTTLHEAFRRHAARRPGAVAIIDEDRALDYATVDAASDAYAVELGRRGVGPSSVVPVVGVRTAEFVTALLAVLKCGGAYAAIDPAWPAARVDAVVRRLGGSVLVTAPTRPVPTPEGVIAWTPAPVAEAAVAGVRHAAPPRSGTDGCAVYFTSGTTGEPKGVLAVHRGTLRLYAPSAFLPVGPHLIMPVAAAPWWDVFSLEVWSTLSSGGTCVVVREPYLDHATLRRLRRDHAITAVFATTSLFSMIVDEDLSAFDEIGHVLVGGERLPETSARAFLTRYPHSRLLNIYGPAEVGIVATTHLVRPQDCARPEGVPLGSPVANTTVQVLDGDRPCEPGEIGEVWIAGDGLGIGYVGDPELTASRFLIADIDGSSRRVYRSGDLGSWSADGVLLYHGRADRQVKIRGHRIEPGEIERAIEAQPEVRRAIVVPRVGQDGAYRELVAFYTTGAMVTADALLDRLRQRLPAYLLPVSAHEVEQFPLTHNGKLDEVALLALVDGLLPADVGGGSVGPDGANDDPTTRRVREIFAAVLGREDVQLDASFFALGGTSLDAGRVCARLGERLGLVLPVSRFMADPTVGGVAGWLNGLGERPPGRSAPGSARPDGPARACEPVPLSAAQIGFWLAGQLDPDDLSAHCLFVYDIQGPVDLAALRTAFGDVQQRHEALRARYGVGGKATARGGPGAPVEIRPVDATGPDVTAAVIAALARPFRLAEANVWRAAVAEVPGGAVLGVAVHHIAFDGWSEVVFATDLSLAYAARSRGVPPEYPAPAPDLQMLHDQRLARGRLSDVDGQRAFWQEHLAGVPELVFPPVPGACAGAQAGSVLTRVLAPGLIESARARHTTPFTLALHAYVAVLAATTGQDDFAVGVPIARRDAPGAALAVGCLLDTLCIRLPPGEPERMLDSNQARLTAAFAAQDVPFDEVVRLVGPARSDRNPLFQAMLVYQDTRPPMLDLPGCSTSLRRPAPLAPMLDLVTEVRPGRDGAADLNVFFDRRRVDEATAVELSQRFGAELERMSRAM